MKSFKNQNIISGICEYNHKIDFTLLYNSTISVNVFKTFNNLNKTIDNKVHTKVVKNITTIYKVSSNVISIKLN